MSAKETKDAAAKPKAKGFDWQFAILGIAFMACALAFLPTTILIFFGMMPTFAALVIDPTPDRIKTMAVGCMNIAGVIPFLLQLWTGGEAQDIGAAFSIVARAESMITMYSAAAAGYIIFYTVSNFVSSIILERGKSRFEEVKKRLFELERKWGREVTGIVPLDERGFPEEEATELDTP